MTNYDELYPVQEYQISERKRQAREHFLIAVLTILIILFSVFGIYSIMLGYVAHNQYRFLQTEAKNIYIASQNWQADGHQLTTKKGSLQHAEFSNYFSDDTGYYALVCDEQGNLQYVLYSKKPIKKLEIPNQEKEYRKLSIPFLRGYTIVSYPPEGNSPFT